MTVYRLLLLLSPSWFRMEHGRKVRATAALLALAMTLLGSLLQALRAVRVDPIVAIRAE